MPHSWWPDNPGRMCPLEVTVQLQHRTCMYQVYHCDPVEFVAVTENNTNLELEPRLHVEWGQDFVLWESLLCFWLRRTVCLLLWHWDSFSLHCNPCARPRISSKCPRTWTLSSFSTFEHIWPWPSDPHRCRRSHPMQAPSSICVSHTVSWLFSLCCYWNHTWVLANSMNVLRTRTRTALLVRSNDVVYQERSNECDSDPSSMLISY